MFVHLTSRAGLEHDVCLENGFVVGVMSHPVDAYVASAGGGIPLERANNVDDKHLLTICSKALLFLYPFQLYFINQVDKAGNSLMLDLDVGIDLA
jgi:hypothetical protein